jgi:hypothetical protein
MSLPLLCKPIERMSCASCWGSSVLHHEQAVAATNDALAGPFANLNALLFMANAAGPEAHLAALWVQQCVCVGDSQQVHEFCSCWGHIAYS